MRTCANRKVCLLGIVAVCCLSSGCRGLGKAFDGFLTSSGGSSSSARADRSKPESKSSWRDSQAGQQYTRDMYSTGFTD